MIAGVRCKGRSRAREVKALGEDQDDWGRQTEGSKLGAMMTSMMMQARTVRLMSAHKHFGALILPNLDESIDRKA